MSENIEIEDYKIRLIGNQGVGKTIFFNKLFTGEFKSRSFVTIAANSKNYNAFNYFVNDGIERKKN